MVHGSRGAYGDPEEPYDASWERNRALVLEAEQLGYDLTLFAQHTVNPRDDSLDELEPWTAAAALAALTQRIELVVAIKPLLYHPVPLAKLALQIEHISRGRLALNVVNAWNKAEFEDAGITFPPHHERYQYGREWLGVVEPLLRGERVHHEGPHFRVRDYMLRSAGIHRPRPRIYTGGASASRTAMSRPTAAARDEGRAVHAAQLVRDGERGAVYERARVHAAPFVERVVVVQCVTGRGVQLCGDDGRKTFATDEALGAPNASLDREHRHELSHARRANPANDGGEPID